VGGESLRSDFLCTLVKDGLGLGVGCGKEISPPQWGIFEFL